MLVIGEGYGRVASFSNYSLLLVQINIHNGNSAGLNFNLERGVLGIGAVDVVKAG